MMAGEPGTRWVSAKMTALTTSSTPTENASRRTTKRSMDFRGDDRGALRLVDVLHAHRETLVDHEALDRVPPEIGRVHDPHPDVRAVLGQDLQHAGEDGLERLLVRF